MYKILCLPLGQCVYTFCDKDGACRNRGHFWLDEEETISDHKRNIEFGEFTNEFINQEVYTALLRFAKDLIDCDYFNQGGYWAKPEHFEKIEVKDV
jgi:hypothetical protein